MMTPEKFISVLKSINKPSPNATALVMATVTRVNPYQVRVDADTEPLPYSPARVGARGIVGSRVAMIEANGHYVALGAILAGDIDTGWIDLPLLSGYRAYSATYTPQYRRVGDTVEMRGLVSPATGTFPNTGGALNVATLPVNARPSGPLNLDFPAVATSSSLGNLGINPNGTVYVKNQLTTGAAYVALTCRFFVG